MATENVTLKNSNGDSLYPKTITANIVDWDVDDMVTESELTTALAKKQDTLTFDTTPTSGSTNPVTSGGIYTALSAKQSTLTFDTTPTSGSTNPVTSGGIYTALSKKANTSDLAAVATSGSYDDLSDTPSKVSEFTNDAGYITSSDVAEYSIEKAATAEDGYVSSYQLTKDGTAVGDVINIPKDLVVESGTVETCTTADSPVSGYAVGDKYIDLVLANSDDSHIYILVSDLVDTYSAGDYITISSNVVSVDADNLASAIVPTTVSSFTNDSGYLTSVPDEYVTETELSEAISGVSTDLSDYYTKTETDTALSAKQDTLTFDETPTEDSSNPVTSGGVYTAISDAVSSIDTSSLSVDLSGYYTSTETDAAIAAAIEEAIGIVESSSY